MSDAIQFHASSRRAAPMLLFFTASLALLPVSARAQCPAWDATVDIKIAQRGIDSPLWMKLAQKGRVLTGTATIVVAARNNDRVLGTVDGTIDGDSFNVQIFWPDHLTGVYSGKVLPSGRLEGETYDKNNPRVRQTWRSEGVLTCPPPPPATPKPIRASGKARPTAPPPPEIKPPGIIASPVIFPAPNNPVGFTIVTWDAGSDHPNAELWFKINNVVQAAIGKQPKGTLQMPVERYKIYTFYLTEAGKTLYTTNPIVP